MNSLGLIGFGAIARTLVEILHDNAETPFDKMTLLVRPGKESMVYDEVTHAMGDRVGRVEVFAEIAPFLATAPDCVVECAGHAAIETCVVSCLDAGIDVIVSSIGALARDDVLERLRSHAAASGARISIPAGAIGGIDALATAKLSGIDEVVYTGRKPAKAWKDTPAEKVADLEALTEECVIFDGNARQAALSFPKNANVAATLALAGVGMDKTRVRLIADPDATSNTHEYMVRSTSVNYSVSLCGKASPLNPKTSLSTAYSLARAVLNRSSAIVI